MKRTFLRVAAPIAVAALALTACSDSGGKNAGNGGSSAAGGDSGAVITVNGSEPQNPLIPTNTNETGGGKIVDPT